MKKRISKDKVQRMRNLVTGDYGASTKKQSGYRKYTKKRIEGDIWEENGRTWTIKNGIKQNFTKLKKARKIGSIPMKCPKCEGAMNNNMHRSMYKYYGHCFGCQTKLEVEMKNKGTYNQWLIDNAKKNFEKWKEEQVIAFEKWFSELDSQKNITESGLIEDWEGLDSKAKDLIIKNFNEHIEKEEKKMYDLIKEQNK